MVQLAPGSSPQVVLSPVTLSLAVPPSFDAVVMELDPMGFLV